MIAQSKVCQELSLMDREQRGNRFELDNDRFLDKHVDLVGNLDITRIEAALALES
jgi:hypothetical protein